MPETDKSTPRPWKESGRNWRGEDDPLNRYIVGACYEEQDEDAAEATVTVCTAVAVIPGNMTAGDIPLHNARLIVRAVNAFDALVAVCRTVVETHQFAEDVTKKVCGMLGERLPPAAEQPPLLKQALAALKLAEAP